tara:strand:+ start:338 stop:916 length:579 start_codon:yes stop_codon:yes gene_type:complete
MVSILCTARSGSTNLSLYLKEVLNLGLITSPFINSKGELGSLKKNNLYKLMIHRLPNGYNDLYEFGKDVINLSDTIILYDRKDKLQQSESLAFKKLKYGNDFSKYHIREPYDNVDEEFVNKCLFEFNKQSEVITRLSKDFNIPIFWYEEIFYEDGLKKLSDYLKIKVNKKTKEIFLSNSKKERIFNLKGKLI